jgi:hypothetical protein
MRDEAVLVLERPHPTPVDVRFTAVSFHEPRRVEVRADDTLLDTIIVLPEPRDFTLRLPSGQGSTRIVLDSLDGTDRPADVSGTSDRRDLSIAMAQVHITAGPDSQP